MFRWIFNLLGVIVYTNRSPIYVRTVDELTVIWRSLFPCDHVIGDLKDSRWQSVLFAKRTKKMVVLSWNSADIVFCPGDAWGERKVSVRERTTVAGKVELITRLLSYNQNRNHPLLVEELNKLASLSWLPLSFKWEPFL